MSFFDKIKNSLGNEKDEALQAQFKRLQEIIAFSLADGVISESELGYINSFFLSTGLKPEDFQKLCSEAFVTVVQRAIADRRVTQAEYQAVVNIAEQLQISPEWKAWAKQEMRYYALFHQIERGGPLPTGLPTSLILQRSEVCHLCIPAKLLQEKVSWGYDQELETARLRRMQGIPYQVNRQRSYLEPQRVLVPISDGYFNITNRRIVFAGNIGAVSAELNQLFDLQLYSDALRFSRINHHHPTFIGLYRQEESEMCGLIISRLLNAS